MPGSASVVSRLLLVLASLPRRIATRSARTTASSIAEREIGSICIPFPWCCRHRPRRPRAALALALVLALPALAPAPTLPLPQAPAPAHHRTARPAAARIHLAQNRLAVALRHRQTL